MPTGSHRGIFHPQTVLFIRVLCVDCDVYFRAMHTK